MQLGKRQSKRDVAPQTGVSTEGSVCTLTRKGYKQSLNPQIKKFLKGIKTSGKGRSMAPYNKKGPKS